MPTITTVDATWDTGVSMDAAELRRADTTMFLGDGSANGLRGGIVRHGDTSLAVSVNGSDQVTVQPGAFVIPAATGLGAYRGALPAVTAATGITARNGTNPRIDLVVIQVDGTAAIVKTIDGTPGASPSAPALPAQHIELARITVPAVGGGAVTVDSTWRAYATGLGGTLYVETSARLPGSGNQKGQRAIALDTGKDHVWDGTAWRVDAAPRGWLGYAQTTAQQLAVGAAATDLAGLSVAVTVAASRQIRIRGQVSVLQQTAAGNVFLQVREGTTVLQDVPVTVGVNAYGTLSIESVITPTAGAHTYKLSLFTSAGALDTQGSATRPHFILVEDIGAA